MLRVEATRKATEREGGETAAGSGIRLVRAYAGELVPARRAQSPAQSTASNAAGQSPSSTNPTHNGGSPSSEKKITKAPNGYNTQRAPSPGNARSAGVNRPTSAKGRLQSAKPPVISNYLNGVGMDVSYVNDRKFHGILPRADMSSAQGGPDTYLTAIPEKYHVWEVVEDDPQSGRIMKRSFPSRLPSSRREVEMLRECYNLMLQDVADPINNFEAAKVVYGSCFNEIIRQVTVHCFERGEFLSELYNGLVGVYENKFEDILTLAKAKHEEYSRHEEEISKIKNTFNTEKSGLNRVIESLHQEIRTLKEKASMYAADAEALRLRERDNVINLTGRLADAEFVASSMKKILDNLGDAVSQSDLVPRLDPKIIDTPDITFKFTANTPASTNLQSPSRVNPNQKANVSFSPPKPSDVPSKYFYGGDEFSNPSPPKSFSRVESKASISSSAYSDVDPRSGMKMLEDKYRAQLQNLGSAVVEGNKFKKISMELEATIKRLETRVEIIKSTNPAAVESRHVGCQTLPLDIPLPPASTKASFTESWAVFFDSFRIGYGKAWPFHHVVKLIDQIFVEKILNDTVCDNDHRPRVNFQQFVHLHFKNKYGLEQLAEQHLTDFLEGVHAYHVDNLRVHTFGKFLGFFVPYSLNNLNLYLHTLNLVNTSIIGPTIPDKTIGVTLVAHAKVVDVARNLFTDRTPEELGRFLQRLEKILETALRSPSAPRASVRPTSAKAITRPTSASRPKSAESEYVGEDADKIVCVSIDKFLLLVMEEAEKESPATDKYLAKLFTASDIYNDGELDFSEFVSIVRFADPTCGIDQAKQIFKEHSDPKTGRLSMVGFLRIGRKYNYASSWMPFLRPANSPESTANYFKSVITEQKKAISIVAHELKMLKSMSNHTATNMHEKLQYREEAVRRLLEEKKDPHLAWIAFKMLMNEVLVCRQWRGSVMAA